MAQRAGIAQKHADLTVVHRARRPAVSALEAIGRGIPADLGQLPVVLALGRTQQAAQIGHGPLSRLRTLEIVWAAALKIVQVRGPS
jgi:hypothetical protein